MRTSDSSSHPVVRAQGPEWAVFCELSWQEGTRAGFADDGPYRTVLQVLDLSTEPLDPAATMATSREPPAEPGRKQREYPHSSGDRNTFPPVEHPHKRNHPGGRQRVAPNDLPRGGPRRGGGH